MSELFLKIAAGMSIVRSIAEKTHFADQLSVLDDAIVALRDADENIGSIVAKQVKAKVGSEVADALAEFRAKFDDAIGEVGRRVEALGQDADTAKAGLADLRTAYDDLRGQFEASNMPTPEIPPAEADQGSEGPEVADAPATAADAPESGPAVDPEAEQA